MEWWASIVMSHDEINRDLTKFMNDGWQLFEVVSSRGAIIHYWEREKPVESTDESDPDSN